MTEEKLKDDVFYCQNCKKDMSDIMPIYEDHGGYLYCSKKCLAEINIEEEFNCLRDALIEIGAADDTMTFEDCEAEET